MSNSLRIRHLRTEDVPAVEQLVKDVQTQSAQQEIKTHLHRMLTHPYLISITLLVLATTVYLSQTDFVWLVGLLESIKFFIFWRRIKGVFSAGKDLQDLLSYYSHPKRLFLIAEMEGTVVGTVAVWQTNDDNTAKLTRMFVSSQCRRMGIGTRLIEKCIEECRSLGYMSLMLRTHVTNHKAVKCYEKAGFVCTGRENFAKLYPHSFDTVNYHLSLTIGN
ncbi:unnamed protein product [Meganyctiphanes norvegica]|uniref:N-acetyltransferase domain-containing protein n=1 Tax=Meganyctiphanes norvegica TaxID=48144 RepID=A0AAV2RDW9_MEGNR